MKINLITQSIIHHITVNTFLFEEDFTQSFRSRSEETKIQQNRAKPQHVLQDTTLI